MLNNFAVAGDVKKEKRFVVRQESKNRHLLGCNTCTCCYSILRFVGWFYMIVGRFSLVSVGKSTLLSRFFHGNHHCVAAAASPSFSQVAMASTANTKDLWILRHGQATHNPRAEAALKDGCSHEEFMDWMRKDDSFDAPLTDLGKVQARTVAQKHPSIPVSLVVASPLSRAVQTADLACPTTSVPRVLHEDFREINGSFLNAKRKVVAELREQFPDWDVTGLATEQDSLWTDVLETTDACGERGYQGLKWLFQNRPESSVLLVAHGGILRFSFCHPRIKLLDERGAIKDGSNDDESRRPVGGRFDNCELRRYRFTMDDASDTILLSEIDML